MPSSGMLRRVTLVIIGVSEDFIAHVEGDTFLRKVCSYRTTWRHFREDGILYRHHSENRISYIDNTLISTKV
jgi:hypothetical protein